MTTSIKKYRFAATFKSVNKVHGTGETISATFSVLSKDKAKYDRVFSDLGELLDDGGRVTITTVTASREYTVEDLQTLSPEVIPENALDTSSTDIWYFVGLPSYAAKYNVLLDVEDYSVTLSDGRATHDTATEDGVELEWPDGTPVSWEEVQELRNIVAAYEYSDATAGDDTTEAPAPAAEPRGDEGVLSKVLPLSSGILVGGVIATVVFLVLNLFHR